MLPCLSGYIHVEVQDINMKESTAMPNDHDNSMAKHNLSLFINAKAEKVYHSVSPLKSNCMFLVGTEYEQKHFS